jgi:excisionase family DNA binding protein
MHLLSSEEAQEQLGISRPTLYLWVRQGKLHPRRAGRSLRFDEAEVMALLGRGPRVSAWIRGGRMEEARRDVGRGVRSNERPTFQLEYLAPPTAAFARGRVVSGGDGSGVQRPAPGGVLFDSLLQSVWGVHDVRAETSPAGESYIAVELARRDGPGEGDDRDRRLRDFLRTMRAGLTERVNPWTKDGTNERGTG